MFKSSPCSPLCPGAHMDQDIGDTGSRDRECHTSIFHKPSPNRCPGALHLCSSSSPGAVTIHRHFCSWKARAGDVFEWETLDVSSSPCSPKGTACSRRVCSSSICSSLDAQFPNDGIFISTVSWLHPAATKCFLACDFSLVHSHKQRAMCSVGVSGSWGLKVLFYTTCNAKHISDSYREIRPSLPSALLQKFKNYRIIKIGKVL